MDMKKAFRILLKNADHKTKQLIRFMYYLRDERYMNHVRRWKRRGL